MILRIRNIIKNGNFKAFVNRHLSTKERFDDKNIRYDVSIPSDADPINQQKRINKYKKSRQLLIRAAKVSTLKMIDVDVDPICDDDVGKKFKVLFDLSMRLEKEYIPASIERILHTSMNAKRYGAAYLPHFMDFERQGMDANIVLEVHPMRLREVIGDRPMMEATGQHIIENLLLGMAELRKYKMVLRDISPQFIALSNDMQ